MLEEKEGLKWWCFNQNNSGGYFIKNKDVLEVVFIQATTEDEVRGLAEDIFCGYEEYCECCGERWSTGYIGAGEDTPMIYGEKLIDVEKTFYREYAVLYSHNGDRAYYEFGKGFINFDEVKDVD